MATARKEFIDKTCQMDIWFIEYGLAHEEILELIPRGAIVAFQDPDDPEFNEVSRRLALAGQATDIAVGEGRKPIVYITFKASPEVGVPLVEVVP